MGQMQQQSQRVAIAVMAKAPKAGGQTADRARGLGLRLDPA
jgi:hypothetical protein